MTTDRKAPAMDKTVDQYADKIMSMIATDTETRPGLASARSFTDLHDHVDANEYMIDAAVPFDPDDDAVQRFYVAVQDAVTVRLRDTHEVGDDSADSKRYAHTFVATVTGLGDVDPFTDALRALLAKHGATLVPCSWAPDPESILDYTPGVDRIDVVDMNPGVTS